LHRLHIVYLGYERLISQFPGCEGYWIISEIQYIKRGSFYGDSTEVHVSSSLNL
jgi:hypothetical protein